MFEALVVGLSLAIAVGTTRRTAHYGASGMTAGMAAMMAAMGTGLSVGYVVGMVWDLGWANLTGVLAGGAHGLWMGRRYGPMAALDGAGGGVMGGLMGPMLAVMLLYLPMSLLLTALLMVALQAAFSLGAVYLVAAAAGAVGATGWLQLVGRVLGAEADVVGAAQDHYATLGVTPDASATDIAEAFLEASRRAARSPEHVAAARAALAVLSDPLRRARYDAARLEEAACCPPEPALRAPAPTKRASRGKRAGQGARAARPTNRAGIMTAVVAFGVAGLVLLGFGSALSTQPAAPRAASGPAQAPNGPVQAAAKAATAQLPARLPGQPPGQPPAQAAEPSDGAAAPTGEVQQVALTLRAPNFEPNLVEVKQGVPVRLTVQAIGDPG